MKNMKMRKFLRGLFAGVLACGCLFAATNVEAKRGYIYDSDGKPIQSSPGFQLNANGVYNVNSTAWKDSSGKSLIAAADIKSLEDLYVYNNGTEDLVYVVDSESNKLFVFDGALNYKQTVEKFEINPDDFTEPELREISSGGSLLTDDIIKAMSQAKETKYEDRTDKQKFYITASGLSCVFRATRPVKDEYGVNTGDYQDVIYLCDKKNKQILLVNPACSGEECTGEDDYKIIDIYTTPKDADFSSKYAPSKMVIDSSGRMYVISDEVYEGIILLNYDGSFMRYVGVNYTTLSFWQALTRNLKTEEQLAQETKILSTKFANLSIDDKNFIYTVAPATYNEVTKVTDDTTMVKKINQTGDDVLVRNGYSTPKGDLVTIKTGDKKGGSAFKGITVNDFGVYTVVDGNLGRLFTYDSEGNLLYISAGNGSEQTDISQPVAVRYQGDDILVLDRGNYSILRFELTDFAKSINKATKHQFYGETEEAAAEWANVIKLNPNYQLAYVGVGKTLHEAGRYQEAMAYFETGDNQAYYSRAYKKYRDDLIKLYFPYVLYGGCALAVGLIGYKIVKKVKNKNPDEEGEVI